MSKNKNPILRAIGYGAIGAIWAVLLLLLAVIAASAAIYADLRSPQEHFWTRGTGLEAIAREMYLSYFRPGWQNQVSSVEYDPELVYVPRIGSSPFQGPEFNHVMTFDRTGLRHQKEVTTDGNDLIVVTGDSQAMGWGVADDETFSSVLAEHYHLHTVNTAVSSYGTAREMLRLRRMGLLEKASMLIIQYCDNDIEENRAYLADPAGFIQKRNPRTLWESLGGYRQSSVSFPLVSRMVYQSLREKIQQGGVQKLIRQLMASPEVTAPTGELDDTSRPANEMAADFVAVLDHFPELNGKLILVVEIDDWGRTTNFIPELKRLASQRKILIPLSIPFQRVEFRRFDNHMNRAGHEKVAKIIFAGIPR